jgi:hypothetical protein
MQISLIIQQFHPLMSFLFYFIIVVLHSPIITEDSAYCDGGSDISSESTIDFDIAKDSGKPDSPQILSEDSTVPIAETADDLPDWLKAVCIFY